MEYMPGGSVKGLMQKVGKLSEKIVKSYIKQTLEGLDRLHSRNLIHGNLKLSNILVGKRGVVKLADAFGSI